MGNATAITFQGKTFIFPIKAYLHFGNKKFCVALIVITTSIVCTMAVIDMITGRLFGILIAVFFVIASCALAFLYQKPRFLIYADRLVVVEHGMLKPKTLYWKDCTLHTTYRKHTDTGKEIPLLHFLHRIDGGDMGRFSVLNLAFLCFEHHHFDVNHTLKFFEKIHSLHKHP